MSESTKKFWPYQPKASIAASAIILVGLLLICGLLKNLLGWPPAASDNTVLIGVLLLSLMPLLLAVLDIVIERGGTVGFKDFKLDFSTLTPTTSPEITVPANIGVQGTPVYETNTRNILNALKEAKKSNIVIVDIEEGAAWWETRLLVLLAGATRLGTPEKIVFVGKVSGQPQTFIGWAGPSVLFGIALSARPQYKQAYYTSQAAAKQWALVEPVLPPAMPVMPFGFIKAALGKQYIAFDMQTGLPNEFTPEEFLQNELGSKVESAEFNKTTLHVTAGKLVDWFGDVLMKDQIDQSWIKEEQARVFFSNDAPYLALTEKGKYLRMVSRVSVINEILKSEVLKNKDKAEPPVTK